MEKIQLQPTKKRKINPPRRDGSSVHAKKEATSNSTNNLNAPHVHPVGGAHLRLQQAKNFAVAQAQKDGSKGNYKIFDSPFGNFMVPVVPTRADLSE